MASSGLAWVLSIALVSLAAVGIIFGWFFFGSTGEVEAQLEVWRARVHEVRASAEPELFTSSMILDCLVMLGEYGDPVSLAKKQAEQTPVRGWESCLQTIAASHAKVNSPEESLAIARLIPNDDMRQSAEGFVGQECLAAGRMEDATAVTKQLTGRHRNHLASRIIQRHLIEDDPKAARQALSLIVGDDATRSEMIDLLDQEARRPKPSQPDFVARNVAFTVTLSRKQFDAGAELRKYLGPKDAKFSEAKLVALATPISQAMKAHHDGDDSACLGFLRTALNVANGYENDSSRVRETLGVGLIAYRLDQGDLARTILRDVTKDPESDSFYILLKSAGQKVFEAMGELLSNQDLTPVVDRWGNDDTPMEIHFLVDALAKQNDFDRIDWVYSRMKTNMAKLIVCSAAIQHLATAGKQ